MIPMLTLQELYLLLFLASWHKPDPVNIKKNDNELALNLIICFTVCNFLFVVWGSFWGQCEKIWGSFRGRDHFSVNLGIISGLG